MNPAPGASGSVAPAQRADRTESAEATTAASPAAGRQIFINYRREDSGGQARALLYALEASFPGQVFMDVKGLTPGVNFLEEIERTVATCRAVLVLIGKTWTTVSDPSGRRRLDDPRDIVVLEVSAALRRKEVLVVPVLVAGAALPSEGELPASLDGLLGRQCLHLTDQDWDYDVGRLVETLRSTVRVRGDRRWRRGLTIGVAAAALTMALVGGIALLRGRGGEEGRGPASPRTATPAPSPPPPASATASGAAATPGSSTPAPATTAVAAGGGGSGVEPAQGRPSSSPHGSAASSPRAATNGRPRVTSEQKRATNVATARPGRAQAESSRVPPSPSDGASRPAPTPARAATRSSAYTTSEIVSFQQVYGDSKLEDRGRRLFESAGWRIEPAGTLTFDPREQATGFFPLTVPITHEDERIVFEGSRVARASDGHGYVRIAGRISPGSSRADASVEIEFGRASGDGSERDPTYRARARLRLVAR